jgi:hypothetical protein
MFSHRNRKKYAVAALVCQIASLVFWQPTHFHFDYVLSSSPTTLTQHADAENCKHLPISDHAQCAVCISSQQKISVEPVIFGLNQIQVIGMCAAEQTESPFFPLHSDSF